GWAVFCSVFALLQQQSYWAFFGIVPLAFVLWFFRDPNRITTQGQDVVVAPADGTIIEIKIAELNRYLPSGMKKISIFMSPFNVHVNRIPIGGVIEELHYHKGRFLTAFHEKASQENEQQFVIIRNEKGIIGCVQIAGWFARRIACHLQIGQHVETGERFGMIKFGSRLDVYIPESCDVGVKLKQKVRAGETILGVFHEEK
ncbi:MAG: phosphatidylserine decarboxylase family protein, partial [bacterium]